MLYGKYHFYCRFESEANLPYYKGSTFRGLFGRALKSVVCALKRQECDQCLLKQRCLYALAFETSAAVSPPKDPRISATPHPFVIEPPLVAETIFPEGSSFDFNLLLFGEVNNNLPYFIYAFDRMGKIGIGKRVNGQRGNFVLKEVKQGKQIIYSVDEQKFNRVDSLEVLSNPVQYDYPAGTLRLKLNLATPLRLKFKNQFAADLPFLVLVRAMLRRGSSLLNSFGDGEPPLDYPGLIKRAEPVKIIESDLKWFDWKRYSFRQDRDMLMGGIVGSVTYEGRIGEYLPLLDFCSRVHIGKQTSFGLGMFKAEIIS